MFGDGWSIVCDSFVGMWHCLRILVLFVIWKLRCMYVFDQELSLVSIFIALRKYEVCHQLLAKGALFLNTSKNLAPGIYFISTLVCLRKWL